MPTRFSAFQCNELSLASTHLVSHVAPLIHHAWSWHPYLNKRLQHFMEKPDQAQEVIARYFSIGKMVETISAQCIDLDMYLRQWNYTANLNEADYPRVYALYENLYITCLKAVSEIEQLSEDVLNHQDLQMLKQHKAFIDSVFTDLQDLPALTIPSPVVSEQRAQLMADLKTKWSTLRQKFLDGLLTHKRYLVDQPTQEIATSAKPATPAESGTAAEPAWKSPGW